MEQRRIHPTSSSIFDSSRLFSPAKANQLQFRPSAVILLLLSPKTRLSIDAHSASIMAPTDHARSSDGASPSTTEKPSPSPSSASPPSHAALSVNNSSQSRQPLDIRFLAIYPLTLFIGLLYAHISPTANPNYAKTTTTQGGSSSVGQQQSSPPINYFAYKRNIVNVAFVKIGWLWTALAFVGVVLIQLQRSSSSPSAIALRKTRVIQAVIRFALATVSWILTTQWAFGPPLFDRGFIATGGKCINSHPTTSATGAQGMTAHGIPASPSSSIGILSSSACKLSGGTWKGGHDISGHVFMLSLTSALLFIEWYGASLPVRKAPMREPTTSSPDNQSSAVKEKPSPALQAEQTTFYRWTRNFVFTVIGLSWWMLLMTTIFFHTWLEKVRVWTLLSLLGHTLQCWLARSAAGNANISHRYRAWSSPWGRYMSCTFSQRFFLLGEGSSAPLACDCQIAIPILDHSSLTS